MSQDAMHVCDAIKGFCSCLGQKAVKVHTTSSTMYQDRHRNNFALLEASLFGPPPWNSAGVDDAFSHAKEKMTPFCDTSLVHLVVE
eukprot:4106560-Amphidinium_carterae.1